MNDQREGHLRAAARADRGQGVADTVHDMRHQVIDDLVARCIPEKAYPEEWDMETLTAESAACSPSTCRSPTGRRRRHRRDRDQGAPDRQIDRKMAQKVATYGPELMRMAEKSLLLQILDHLWKEHLLNLDHLRQGIHLRGYGRRDPLNEYKEGGVRPVRGPAHQPAPDGDAGAHASRGARAAPADGRRGRGSGTARGDRH